MRRTTNRDLEQIRALCVAGRTVTEIAAALGCTRWVVMYWGRQLGLTFIRRRVRAILARRRQ